MLQLFAATSVVAVSSPSIAYQIVEWGGVAGLIIIGIFGIIGLLDKSSRQRQSDVDVTGDRLIDRLKEEVDLLTKRMSEQDKVIAALDNKLTELTSRNKVLEEIAQGYNPEALRFQKVGFETFTSVDHMLKMASDNNTMINRINLLLETILKGQSLKVPPLDKDRTPISDNVSPVK